MPLQGEGDRVFGGGRGAGWGFSILSSMIGLGNKFIQKTFWIQVMAARTIVSSLGVSFVTVGKHTES